jgi:hypothetical protein
VHRYGHVLLLILAVVTPAAAQTTRDVHVPPVEFGAGVTVDHKTGGAVFAVSGNVRNTLAVTAEAGKSVYSASALAGARISTGFFYDGAPPMPGRFFAQLLVGAQVRNGMSGEAVVKPGAGADVIVAPSRGVALHWSIDYRIVPGAPPGVSGPRLVVGLVFGPRT